MPLDDRVFSRAPTLSAVGARGGRLGRRTRCTAALADLAHPAPVAKHAFNETGNIVVDIECFPMQTISHAQDFDAGKLRGRRAI